MEENNNRYNHREVEPKWKKKSDETRIYRAIDFDKKPKKYILFEFPYPSGDRLHVGHGRSYTALDAMARKLRMQGFNVMLPMGWDAFGLPAENYAIKNKVNPNVVVKQNIEHAKAQAKRWGLSIDWDREIDTTDPKYYQWTQWIFIQLFKKGLAYRQEVAVNWCSFCKTNLANEEVLSDGTHERCGNKTERRMQKQWLLKITKYADRLLEDLKTRKVNIPVIVRAETIKEAKSLYSRGADFVILPEVMAGDMLMDILKDHMGDNSYFKDRPRIELEKLSHKTLSWG